MTSSFPQLLTETERFYSCPHPCRGCHRLPAESEEPASLPAVFAGYLRSHPSERSPQVVRPVRLFRSKSYGTARATYQTKRAHIATHCSVGFCHCFTPLPLALPRRKKPCTVALSDLRACQSNRSLCTSENAEIRLKSSRKYSLKNENYRGNRFSETLDALLGVAQSQNRPTTLPSSSMSTFSPAGWVGRPGIVLISPQSG